MSFHIQVQFNKNTKIYWYNIIWTLSLSLIINMFCIRLHHEWDFVQNWYTTSTTIDSSFLASKGSCSFLPLCHSCLCIYTYELGHMYTWVRFRLYCPIQIRPVFSLNNEHSWWTMAKKKKNMRTLSISYFFSFC